MAAGDEVEHSQSNVDRTKGTSRRHPPIWDDRSADDNSTEYEASLCEGL